MDKEIPAAPSHGRYLAIKKNNYFLGLLKASLRHWNRAGKFVAY